MDFDHVKKQMYKVIKPAYPERLSRQSRIRSHRQRAGRTGLDYVSDARRQRQPRVSRLYRAGKNAQTQTERAQKAAAQETPRLPFDGIGAMETETPSIEPTDAATTNHNCTNAIQDLIEQLVHC